MPQKRSQIATTVVLPVYNNKRTLATTVRSLLVCDPAPDQIIVVDDGSSDTGLDAIAELPRVTFIRIDHQGRAAALNRGIQSASGDWILFTDADCYVPPDWIQRLFLHMESGLYAGVGGNLLPSRHSVIEVAKVQRYIEDFEQPIVLENKYAGVCLNGNNMAIRKEAILDAGGFDESYLHGADADLTSRLVEKGYTLLRCPEVVTYHLKVDSVQSFLRTAFLRGSTIRFSDAHASYTFKAFVRTVFLAVPKAFFFDLSRIGRLDVFGSKSFGMRNGILGAVANLISGWVNAFGRIYFVRKFRRDRRA
jgi:glycosyltransferase involved in cell wall biosynthesis